MQTILSEQTNAQDHSINFTKVIEAILCVLVLILPVFFLPVTAEAVGFNKVYLVVFTSLLTLLLFFVFSFKSGKLKVLQPKVYMALIALLLAGGLSVLLSINRNISLYGYYGNYSSSFIYLTATVILAFVVSNLKVSVKKILDFFLIGVTLSTLISFIPFYGFSIPFLGAATREFTLSGSPSAFLGLQVLTVLTALYFLSSDLTKGKLWKIVYGLAIALNLSYVLGTLNVFALGILTVGFIYLLATRRVNFKKNLEVFIPVVGIVVIMSVFSLLPQTQKLLGINAYNTPLRMPVAESWWVSANSIRDFPLTGTGSGTFAQNFSRYRPASLNYSDFWQARFSNPFNDLFMWLSVAGIVGLAVYVFYWVKLMKDSKGLDNKNETNFIVKFSLAVSLAVVLLLGYNYILSALIMIMYGVVLNRKYKDQKSINLSNKYVNGALITLAVVLLVGFGYIAYQKYTAQILFRKSVRNANLVERYNTQKRVLALDPRESLYRRENILTGLLIARQLAQQENLTDNDREVFQRVIQEAVLDSRRLTEVINPLDVANWEIRGLTYNSLIGLNQNAFPFAVGAYTTAIDLESSNPSLWLTRGQVYYSQGQYLSAAQDFARAVQLKNDYANAHYNLAFALKELNDNINAAVQMEIVLRLIPQDSPDREKIQADLDELKKLAEEQQKQILQQQAAQQQAQLDLQNQQQQAQQLKANSSTEPLSEPDKTADQQITPKEELTVGEEVLNQDTDVNPNTPEENPTPEDTEE
jgi:hypothetical protein